MSTTKTKQSKPTVAAATSATAKVPATKARAPAVQASEPVASAAAASSTANAAVNTTIPVMNAPPKVKMPSPPAGFVPVNALDLRGYRPMQSELASVPEAVKELNAFPSWSAVFGITAEPAAQIAQRLEVALLWTALYAASTLWDSYVKSQEGMAWKDALESIEALKPAFALASTANPSMLKQYPSIGRLLGAQKVVARRGASTRAKNEKATAKAQVTASGAAANAPAAAVPVASDPSGTSARTVTVTG